MAENRPGAFLRSARVLILGIVAVVIVIGLALVVRAISGPNTTTTPRGVVDALATSSDSCVTCHRRTTPGIVEQYGHSTMAASNVACRDCHEVSADYPGAVAHEGTYVLGAPTPARCQRCHGTEVAQFDQSRHSLPAYVAMVGKEGLTPEQLAQYTAIPEAVSGPPDVRNALYNLEGPDITKFACEACHNIGAPRADGSIGDCTKCHLRHEFSLEQARKPETCNNCHIGPDHPQWEIYQESPHGIKYATSGSIWNWTAPAGTLTVSDFPAPTCATCHISGFGGQGTTHDVGDRLSWFNFAQVSQQRPDWQTNRVRMQSVCRECHNQQFINDFYTAADKAVVAVNAQVQAASALMADLQAKGLVNNKPFDEPIDFTAFELWHHWGRTAKFGAWMQGPDYTQWHGAYELLHAASELQDEANKLQAASEQK
jgi:hydroxylamine dehydrogenase